MCDKSPSYVTVPPRSDTAPVGLAAAAGLSVIGAHGNGLRLTFTWLAWFVLVLRLTWKVLEWRAGYFLVASDRVVLVSGGLLLGYGELVFHAPCPDAALVALDYAPYPFELFREVCELAFPGASRLWQIPRPVECHRQVSG
jgi:hypothetical protein